MKRAMTIAGSDSGGGAGIQADLKTFSAHGVYGTTVITAITAQNTKQVTRVLALPADVVTAQIGAIMDDIGTDAAKTGMLANAELIHAVARSVDVFKIPKLVVDPVMVAKSGDRLLEESAIDAIRTELLPRALVVTPNLPEAEALSRIHIRSEAMLEEAAKRLHAMGPRAVIIKGGHGEGSESVDLLFDGSVTLRLRAPRVQTRNTHGTGCTFAAALAANLALDLNLHSAARAAKEYVTEALRHGLTVGHGHGPLGHFWAFDASARPTRPA